MKDRINADPQGFEVFTVNCIKSTNKKQREREKSKFWQMQNWSILINKQRETETNSDIFHEFRSEEKF